jgi:hypothetical protein
MPIRKTPSGRWVEEDHAGNLSLVGNDHDIMSALAEVADDHYIHITFVESPLGGHHHVTIGVSHDEADGEAEYGNDPTLSRALRYALGYHYGGHEDPIVKPRKERPPGGHDA